MLLKLPRREFIAMQTASDSFLMGQLELSAAEIQQQRLFAMSTMEGIDLLPSSSSFPFEREEAQERTVHTLSTTETGRYRPLRVEHGFYDRLVDTLAALGLSLPPTLRLESFKVTELHSERMEEMNARYTGGQDGSMEEIESQIDMSDTDYSQRGEEKDMIENDNNVWRKGDVYNPWWWAENDSRYTSHPIEANHIQDNASSQGKDINPISTNKTTTPQNQEMLSTLVFGKKGKRTRQRLKGEEPAKLITRLRSVVFRVLEDDTQMDEEMEYDGRTSSSSSSSLDTIPSTKREEEQKSQELINRLSRILSTPKKNQNDDGFDDIYGDTDQDSYTIALR